MKKESYGKKVVAVLMITLFVGNYFQYQLSPLASRLMEEMNLTPMQFSSIFSAPMIPAIALGIVAGILSDKFGVKAVTSISLLITTIGLCFRPFANNYGTLMLSMILAGIGVTFINVNMSKLIGGWYPLEKVGQMVGIGMMGSTLGMTVATAISAMFTSVKVAFMVTGVASILVFILWIVFIKDGEQENTSESSHNESVINTLLTVLKSKNIWLVGICLMCIMGCNVAVSSFLPIALQSRGVSESTSGLLLSVFTIGSLFGAFIGTSLISKFRKMKLALMIWGGVSAICVAFGWKLPVIFIVVTLLIAGFCIGSLIPTFMSFPMLLPEIGPAYAGSAGGIITTLELLGAVILPTYVMTPLAGENFTVYFLMAGGAMIVMDIVVILLPELNKSTK